MNVYIIVLRLIHIFAGIFWVGTLWYFALFFLPRVKTFGQETGRIMQTLQAPPFPTTMTAAGAAVVLSGMFMYWHDSAGLRWSWVGTPTGIVLGIAGLLGILTLLEGLVRSRPAAERMAHLGRQVAASGSAPSPAVVQEMQALAAKLERGIYRMAYILLLTVIGMASARYL